jgi:hypothetical protein
MYAKAAQGGQGGGAQPGGGAAQDGGTAGDSKGKDDVVEAEFEEVKE